MSAFNVNYLISIKATEKKIPLKESVMTNPSLYEFIPRKYNFSLLEIPCILSSNLKQYSGLDVGSKFLIKIEKQTFLMKVVHSASRIPSLDRMFSDQVLD